MSREPAAPVVGRAASLHHDLTDLAIVEETLELRAIQPLAWLRSDDAIGDRKLKTFLAKSTATVVAFISTPLFG
ncbi:MAG: hypothetical protein R3E83_11655 [Burkholderiaceae bacterium]